MNKISTDIEQKQRNKQLNPKFSPIKVEIFKRKVNMITLHL